jgi:Ca-activated chloride channel family protein
MLTKCFKPKGEAEMTDTLELTLTTDQDLIPREVPAQRILEIAVQAPDAAVQAQRPALNLALVLDRSGSMHGEKLEYVKQAALQVLDLLQPQDRVALVSYDDEVNLLSPSLPVTPANREELRRCIRPLQSGGSTNLSGGWLAGCQEVAAAAGSSGATLNRALLLTDGLANCGIQDLEELAVHARELASRGITTSTFGVGRDFNEHLLEAMSNQGKGSFYYIESPAQLPGMFAREFSELAAVTAEDVQIVVEVPAGVSAEVLGGWRVEQISGGQVRISIGNLYAGRRQELYVRLLTPPAQGQDELVISAAATAKGLEGKTYDEHRSWTLRYAPRAEADAAPVRTDVRARFAGVDLAHTANEALKLERKGQRDEASKLLQQSIEANRPCAAPATIREYENMSNRMKRGMDEADRKHSHVSTYEQKQRREPR